MDIARGLAMCIRNAWRCLDIVVFDAGSFGGNQDVTLKHLLVFVLGAIVLVKFVRFCMGGSFNSAGDRANYETFSNFVTHPYGTSLSERGWSRRYRK